MVKKIKEINPNNFGALLFGKGERKKVNKVLKDGMIFRYGYKKSIVDEVENKIEGLFNVKHCIATTSGTSGLIAALSVLGLRKGDRVLVSSYTFLATALAVLRYGATPVPIDIDITNGLDFQDLKEEVEKGCKAVIIVHLQGRTFDLNKIQSFLKEKNIPLIEDACQSFYCSNGKQYSGTIGDIGVFSFQQFKQLSCGEGGAVITNNSEYAKTIRNFTDMGSVRDGFPSWDSEGCVFGENYRMTTISASIISEQLQNLDHIIKKQRWAREFILDKLQSQDIKVINSFYPLGDSAMNILLELCDDQSFDQVQNFAKNKGIVIRKMWSGVYYNNKLFNDNKLTSCHLKGRECEKTIKITNRMLTLPIPPVLKKNDCIKIVELLVELRKRGQISGN